MKDQLIATIENRKAELERAAVVIPTLPDLPSVQAHFLSESTYTIGFPYRAELINENRKAMEAAGFTYSGDHQFPQDGEYWQYFAKDRINVDLFYQPALPGSTCKLNLIGYEQPRPIYETVCLNA